MENGGEAESQVEGRKASLSQKGRGGLGHREHCEQRESGVCGTLEGR